MNSPGEQNVGAVTHIHSPLSIHPTKRKALASPETNEKEFKGVKTPSRKPSKTRIVTQHTSEVSFDQEDVISISDETSVTEASSAIKSKRIGKDRRSIELNKSTREALDEEDDDDYVEISRKVKTKTKKSKDKTDKTVKNPIRTPRGKKKIPEIIPRDRVDLELCFSRDKWLKMSSSELGAACLDHLAEIEKQRLLCGNLSSRTDGMLKDCGAAAKNIIGALVEKLEE